MIALSLSQPWADLVVDGTKTIENRTKPYSFRTPFPQKILIHRAKSYDAKAPLWIRQTCKNCDILGPQSFAELPGSLIIGSVEIIDARPPGEIVNAYDRCWVMEGAAWCYVLRNAIRFETPIPYRGLPSFFTIPDTYLESA